MSPYQRPRQTLLRQRPTPPQGTEAADVREEAIPILHTEALAPEEEMGTGAADVVNAVTVVEAMESTRLFLVLNVVDQDILREIAIHHRMLRNYGDSFRR